ncbi:MAG TPA: hypothetical protein VK735_18805 [Pseudonocardia sp.]|uniref:hypothetical protein n=1 Tax=Pseudonocardia sp. TaxID=60912 RepID=UPI002BB25CAF|nr:hypothetical protein [Pseudonocardia sp.]HTF49498.1 hypothetical protein [Pseudonocardia sp.]
MAKILNPLRRRPQPTTRVCGQLPPASRPRPGDHPCALPAGGHTMHRCAFGDCAWGS